MSVPVGDWNHAIGVIGAVGCGKSTYAAARALELAAAAAPAYIVAHDPTWRIPTSLPDGRTVPLRRFQDLAEARVALRTDAAGIIAPTATDGGKVLEFAREIAEKSKGGERVDLGTPAVPVVALVDEARMLETSAPGRLRGVFLDLLIGRRHRHVALVYTVQSPKLVDTQLLSGATELALFRIIDDSSLKRLRDEVGVPQDVLDRVQSFPEGSHEYVLHRV